MSSVIERLTAALSDRYRIERELGAGGMATVYLAHDLKHQRDVAIKVLHPDLGAALGSERFLSEIRTTARLQHPHILPLLDSGEADRLLYYVMPLVTGETLRSRLERESQLPIDDAVLIAREVADALGYAHGLGVIHRDIKPENILLQGGHALVADFGIALAVQSAGGQRMTQTGLSLGTPQYMSPEQAMGEKQIDARSDIYALGCVLYEMLVGEPPFTGPSVQAIVAKVMTDGARPPRQLRKSVPTHVEGVVMTALEKLPADRFASAAAFNEALTNVHFDAATTSALQAAMRGRSSRVRRVGVAAAWVVVGGTAAALGLRRWGAAPAAASVQREQATYSGLAVMPAISPDGRFVAYLESRCPERPAEGGCVRLRVLEVGTSNPVEVITGADRLASPRWTHDGLALVVGGSLGEGKVGLFTVPRLGGTPRRLAEEPLVYDTHAKADSVAFVTGGDSGRTLHIVAIASGDATGSPLPIPFEPFDVAWSPDGDRLAFAGSESVHVMQRKDGALLHSEVRVHNRPTIRWSAGGTHILTFAWTAGQDDNLVAFPVASDGHLGEQHLLMSLVPTLLEARFDVARNTGRLVVGSGAVFYDEWVFDLSGATAQAQRLTQGTNWHGPPALSADGRALYYLRADPAGNSLYRVVDGEETPVTAERQVVNNSVRFSRDEQTMTFESRIDSTTVLMIYDVATSTTRHVPRRTNEYGWLLPGAKEILWLSQTERSLAISDADGRGRRDVLASVPGDRSELFAGGLEYGTWALAPDGESAVILGGNRETQALYRVALRGGPLTTLARFQRSAGAISISGWADGTIHLARTELLKGTTTLLRLDVASGAIQSGQVLPVPCSMGTTTLATSGRRAACVVADRRSDIMLMDGVRP